MTMSNKANFKFSLAMMIVFAVAFVAAVVTLVSGVINTVGILALLGFLTGILGIVTFAFIYATVLAYYDRNQPDIK